MTTPMHVNAFCELRTNASLKALTKAAKLEYRRAQVAYNAANNAVNQAHGKQRAVLMGEKDRAFNNETEKMILWEHLSRLSGTY